MAAKSLLVICIQALMVHTICALCLGNAIGTAYNAGLGLSANSNGLTSCGAAIGNGLPALGLLTTASLGGASNGGGLTVTSTSPIAPSGLSIISDYAFEGPINVVGQVPFLSAVGLEGPVSSGGLADVKYSCGDGTVGIVSESFGNSLGLGAGLGLGSTGLSLARAGLGSGVGLGAGLRPSLSCGCNGVL